MVIVAGCGDNLVGAPPLGYEAREPEAVDPAEGYPEPPPQGYGGDEGDVLPDMRFAGYPTDAPSDVPVSELPFSDSVTLSGIRQLDGYTHMLLTVAAEWCKPCREEAEILPDLYREWAAKGGYVLGVINQDRLYNSATDTAVRSWSERYGTNYTLTFDPQGFVAAYLNPSTVPLNVVVDLRTMRVLRSRVGEDPDTFRFFDRVLSER